jgi:hypothetical protein
MVMQTLMRSPACRWKACVPLRWVRVTAAKGLEAFCGDTVSSMPHDWVKGWKPKHGGPRDTAITRRN